MTLFTSKGIPYPGPFDRPNVGPDIDALGSAVDQLIGSGVRNGTFSGTTAAETLTSATYASLPTPDKITVNNPQNGFNAWVLQISYYAKWAASVAATAKAAIFLNGTQLKKVALAAAPAVSEATLAFTTANAFAYVITDPQAGIVSPSVPTSSVSDPASGTPYVMQVSSAVNGGGIVAVMLLDNTPTTYTVEVKYQISTGTLTVKERWLAAKTIRIG
jgi:hypothetical protein